MYATFANDVTGECIVPEVFADDLRVLTASLDWARVWGARHKDYPMAAQELRSAATAAESLARACREWAEAADDATTTKENR